MSAGLPAVTATTQTGFSQRFFQEVYAAKTLFPPKIVSLIFDYQYPSETKHLDIKILHSITWEKFVTNYFLLFGIVQDRPTFPPLLAPSLPVEPLLMQFDALIYEKGEGVGFIACGTTLMRHTRAISEIAATTLYYPLLPLANQDTVRVMAYNPLTSTLMIGSEEGVVASKDFTQASAWREFPRAPLPHPLHFLAPRGLGFITVSPRAITVCGKRSIQKVVARASDGLQFRTAAYNPLKDTLGVVCRFEGFNTVQEYSVATGTCTGEAYVATPVLALTYHHENWIIVTETYSENSGIKEPTLTLLNIPLSTYHTETTLAPNTQLPPEASQMTHKQYSVVQDGFEFITSRNRDTCVFVYKRSPLPPLSYQNRRKQPPLSTSDAMGGDPGVSFATYARYLLNQELK